MLFKSINPEIGVLSIILTLFRHFHYDFTFSSFVDGCTVFFIYLLVTMCAFLFVLLVGIYIISQFSLYTVNEIDGLQYSKLSGEFQASS